MSVRIVRHPTADGFLARDEAWLLEAEAEHNLPLALAGGLRSRPLASEYFATIECDGAVAGCAFRTPPYKFGVTRMPAAAIPVLVDAVGAVFPTLDLVLGPPDTAAAFARTWCDRTGASPRPGLAQRIYRLDRVQPPPHPPAGLLRTATSDDLTLVAQWLHAFGEEAHPVENPEAMARMRVERGEIALWVDDGVVRSMAASVGRTRNGARIGMVYTPPAARERGYASACVAALSQRVLDDGARFCMLYTDLANPVSNAIYQRIGYVPVADATDWWLR